MLCMCSIWRLEFIFKVIVFFFLSISFFPTLTFGNLELWLQTRHPFTRHRFYINNKFTFLPELGIVHFTGKHTLQKGSTVCLCRVFSRYLLGNEDWEALLWIRGAFILVSIPPPGFLCVTTGFLSWQGLHLQITLYPFLSVHGGFLIFLCGFRFFIVMQDLARSLSCICLDTAIIFLYSWAGGWVFFMLDGEAFVSVDISFEFCIEARKASPQ